MFVKISQNMFNISKKYFLDHTLYDKKNRLILLNIKA